MSKLTKKQTNLRKAGARFAKVSRRTKQIQIRFERSQKKNGRFKTSIRLKRGQKEYHGSNRGLLHRAVNLRYRIKGDAPSVTRLLGGLEPKTRKGKVFQRTAQAVNFIAHDVGKTAVDAALASETVGLKSADIATREVKTKLTQKYTHEAVDDYHKGTLETLRLGADAVKGTRRHLKQRKQAKIEKAKFRLQKAEYQLFKVDTYQPKIFTNKADLKQARAVYQQHKNAFPGKKSKLRRQMVKRRKQICKQSKRKLGLAKKQLTTDYRFKRAELKNQRKIVKNSSAGIFTFKPVRYGADRMKSSVWQKAVNEDADNDVLHAFDSVKRRIADPMAHRISRPERLQREQKKRDRLTEQESKTRKKLNKQENKLKEKGQKPPNRKKKKVHQKSFSEKFKAFCKSVTNVYTKEVGKFFATIAVPIFIIFLVFAFLIMIFSSIVNGGSFTLGTYTAQDYDLTKAEEFYTQLAWKMNENVRKVGSSSEWIDGLVAFGADPSNLTDTPDEWAQELACMMTVIC